MKILHIVDSAGFYGAEAVIITLAKEQVSFGDVPVICALIGDSEQEPAIIPKACEIGLKATPLFVQGNIFHQSEMIYKYALSNEFDVIHSHGYRPGILLAIKKRTSSIPIVRTLHGWTHISFFSKIFLYNFIDALLLWRNDAVVVVSKNMKENAILKFIPKIDIHVVHNGIIRKKQISIGINKLDDIKFTELSKNTYLIGAIGRLSPEKSQSDMIRAIARLRSKGYPVSLVIIGEGRERHSLERLALELDVSEFIHLTGYLDTASNYIHLFKILCISSLTEGLPITILEAMRENVPVIATSVGDIPELLGEGRGILVLPHHPEEIADRIEELITNPERVYNIVQSASAYFKSHHTSRSMALKYKDIYQNVVA